MAIAGIIISAAGMVIQVILVIALIVGGASYASKAIDEAKTDSFYSQSSSGNGDSSDKSKAQDNLDDVLDDTLGETHDDLTDGRLWAVRFDSGFRRLFGIQGLH